MSQYWRVDDEPLEVLGFGGAVFGAGFAEVDADFFVGLLDS